MLPWSSNFLCPSSRQIWGLASPNWKSPSVIIIFAMCMTFFRLLLVSYSPDNKEITTLSSWCPFLLNCGHHGHAWSPRIALVQDFMNSTQRRNFGNFTKLVTALRRNPFFSYKIQFHCINHSLLFASTTSISFFYLLCGSWSNNGIMLETIT